MCHLPPIHHLSNHSLLSLFLSPIKTAEHLIYLRYGKCDLMGVFQSNLILCRSQCSQVALSSLPSLLSSPFFSPPPPLKDGNQIPSVWSNSMCEDTEKDDSDGLEQNSHFRLLRPLFLKKSLIDLRNDLSGLL